MPSTETKAIPVTPGHTVGPYFHHVMGWASTGSRADDPALGSIRIEGTIEDANGERLPAWLLEVWVPEAVDGERAAGRPAPGFRRLMSNAQGDFSFRVPTPQPGQPAAYVTVFGVGLTRSHFSAVFVDEQPSELLDAVPAQRRSTLIAQRIGTGEYRWVIRTQGERETVFLDYR